MKKTYGLGRKEAAPSICSENLRNSSMTVMRKALALCLVSIPVVGFNIFASAQQNETVVYWSLAITATFALFASVFVLWATNILWPGAGLRGAKRPVRAFRASWK